MKQKFNNVFKCTCCLYLQWNLRYSEINLRLKYFLSLWISLVKINSCTNLSQIVDADGRGHFISVHKHNIVGRSLHHDLHLQEMTDALVIPTTTTKKYQLRLSPSIFLWDWHHSHMYNYKIKSGMHILPASLSLSLTHTHLNTLYWCGMNLFCQFWNHLTRNSH